jgi:hypothetical protein
MECDGSPPLTKGPPRRCARRCAAEVKVREILRNAGLRTRVAGGSPLRPVPAFVVKIRLPRAACLNAWLRTAECQRAQRFLRRRHLRVRGATEIPVRMCSHEFRVARSIRHSANGAGVVRAACPVCSEPARLKPFYGHGDRCSLQPRVSQQAWRHADGNDLVRTRRDGTRCHRARRPVGLQEVSSRLR